MPKKMNSKLWVRFFFTTLLIGAGSTVISGLIFRWSSISNYFINWDTKEVVGILVWLIGMGLLFSVISQMGFFAYITLHRLALGLFRGARLWSYVQVLLIFVALADFIYLRDKVETHIALYIGLAIFLVLYSFLVARKKVKETNAHTFIPTMFFMIVITIIEWIPALQAKEINWLLTMIFPLVICNTYQILTLHKINRKVEEITKIKKSS